MKEKGIIGATIPAIQSNFHVYTKLLIENFIDEYLSKWNKNVRFFFTKTRTSHGILRFVWGIPENLEYSTHSEKY